MTRHNNDAKFPLTEMIKFDRKKYMRTFDEYIKVDLPYCLDNICQDKSSIKHWIEDDILFIDNILTSEWCEKIIKSTDEHYKSMKSEYQIDQRDSDRFLTINKELSLFLWTHIKDYMDQYMQNAESPITSKDTKRPNMPFGFGVKGKWKPVGINECFRFNKYTGPSIGFKPHRDSLYVESYDSRSIYTILIYLNELKETDSSKENGETVFIEPLDVELKEFPTVSEEIENGFKITSKIKPKQGMIAIMSHNRIHCGAPIETINEKKYVVRSDVVFECYERPDSYDPSLWRTSDLFLKSVGLYNDAKQYEMSGKINESSECYEKGLAIRQHTYI